MHRWQLLETAVLMTFGALVMLFIAQGGHILATTRIYTARATLIPNATAGIFTGEPGSARAPAIDASYLIASDLRDGDFLYREIDDHNLAQFPQLDDRWNRGGSIRAEDVYSGLSNAIAVRITRDGNLAVAVSATDPRLANSLLTILVIDLRARLRAATVDDLRRTMAVFPEPAMLPQPGVSSASATAYAADSSRDQALAQLIALVHTTPDFAFAVKYQPMAVEDTSDLFGLAGIALATMIVLTLGFALLAHRSGSAGRLWQLPGSGRRPGMQHVA